MTRRVELAIPDDGDANNFPLERMLGAVFVRLAAGRALPESWDLERYPSRTCLTAEGDGLEIEVNQPGAHYSDWVETSYRLRVGDDIRMTTSVMGHATQSMLEIEIAASAETLDVATDALLECAAKAGLVFVRRGDR